MALINKSELQKLLTQSAKRMRTVRDRSAIKRVLQSQPESEPSAPTQTQFVKR